MSIYHSKILFFSVFILFTFSISAQISISLLTDNKRYISYEPVKVKITLKNYTGHVLNFGTSPDEGGYMIFHVKDRNGMELNPIIDYNPVSGLILSAGVLKTVTFTLTNYFSLPGDDDYMLNVRIGHRRLPRDLLSKPVYFEVRKGIKVWERSAGVPTSESVSLISTRNCSLNIFHVGKGEIYYLQIESDEYVYSIHRLGPRIYGIDPQCEIDALSRIHTLILTAPRLFNYRVFDLNGNLKQETSYFYYASSQPKLMQDSEFGMVRVVGGKIAQTGVDYNVKEKPELAKSKAKTEKDKK